MRLNKCLLVLCAFLFSFGLSAQTVTTATFQNTEANLDAYQAGSKSAVHLNQVGNTNTTLVNQSGSTIFNPNMVRAMQQGEQNTLSIIQQGGHLRTDALQMGNQNNYLSVVTGGQANTTLVVQNGNTNVVEQKIVNSAGVKTEFIQNGDANYIKQDLENIYNQTYKLTQNGNGLKAVIVQKGQ
jgi:hypothetical protein